MRNGYIKFIGYRTPSKTEPVVSVQKRYVVVMNRASHELLHRPEWVTLWYKKDEHTMIIAPATKGTEGATQARKQGRSSSRFIAGMAFASWNKIEFTEARNFTPTLEDGYLVVDLTKGTPAVGLSYRKHKANGKPGTLQNALEGVKEALTHQDGNGQGNGAKISGKQLQQLRQIIEQLEVEPE